MRFFGINITLDRQVKLKIQKLSNRLLGPLRIIPLAVKKKDKFTIISNNCWGGFVYGYFSKAYQSPTIGLYFFSEDYVKFVYNLKYYLSVQPCFISYKESRHRESLEKYGGMNLTCPIGIFDDIEVVFLHYKSPEDALNKWNRRKERIQWDSIFFKMSEQNECTMEHLLAFDKLPAKNKIVFTSKNYHLPSQIVFKEFLNQSAVFDDVTHFRHHINLTRWLLQKDNYKK